MKDEKVFIIAEMSANHGNDIEVAKETIRAAKRAGADAIKLQTYKPETITLNHKSDNFLIKTFVQLYSTAEASAAKAAMVIVSNPGLRIIRVPTNPTMQATQLPIRAFSPRKRIAANIINRGRVNCSA